MSLQVSLSYFSEDVCTIHFFMCEAQNFSIKPSVKLPRATEHCAKKTTRV